MLLWKQGTKKFCLRNVLAHVMLPCRTKWSYDLLITRSEQVRTQKFNILFIDALIQPCFISDCVGFVSLTLQLGVFFFRKRYRSCFWCELASVVFLDTLTSCLVTWWTGLDCLVILRFAETRKRARASAEKSVIKFCHSCALCATEWPMKI